MSVPTFTVDWFDCHIPVWRQHVLPRLAKIPHARFLEVGSYEGRSARWLHANAAIDELTCVDWFYDDYGKRFDANIALLGPGPRIVKCKGPSHEILRTLPLAHYAAAYVDGSHYVADVLRDAVLCFDLVQVGGLLIFDDYLFEGPDERERPKPAIDSFLSAYADRLVQIDTGMSIPRRWPDGWQVMVERTK